MILSSDNPIKEPPPADPPAKEPPRSLPEPPREEPPARETPSTPPVEDRLSAAAFASRDSAAGRLLG